MSTGTVGVLLAGGLARRMGGGDKSLLELDGQRILDRVIARAQPQVDALVLNANGEPERFRDFGLPVASDVIGEFAGPLAGILTGMDWARREVPEAKWLVSFATDAPFLPADMVTRFHAAVAEQGAEIVCAMSQDRTHPVFALWPLRLMDELRAVMENEEMRKIDLWTARYRTAHVSFMVDADGIDPFFNVNRPENLEEASRLLGQTGAT